MARTGRPSLYTPELADKILAAIEQGQSLRAICSKAGMPARETVHRWLNDQELSDFRNRYARSRDIGLDVMADEVLRIASTPKKGKTRKTGPNGVEETEADMLGHRRLQVDTMKWYLSKLAPRRYGDRLELTGSVVFDRAGALRRAREARQAPPVAEGDAVPESPDIADVAPTVDAFEDDDD